MGKSDAHKFGNLTTNYAYNLALVELECANFAHNLQMEELSYPASLGTQNWEGGVVNVCHERTVPTGKLSDHPYGDGLIQPLIYSSHSICKLGLEVATLWGICK